jgi:hypothetical protein
MKIRLSLFLILTLGMFTGNVFADGAYRDNDPIPLLGSVDAQLIRNDNGISVHGTVYGAVPGNAYTVWWIITDGDEFIILNATGGIANAEGELRFAAGLPADTYVPGEGSREVLFPGTFANPRDALVQMDVISHGPMVPGRIKEQISSLFDCKLLGGQSPCDLANPPPAQFWFPGQP